MNKNNNKKNAADDKAEFIIEVAERYNYWIGKNQPDYAALYERMLQIVTSPKIVSTPETAQNKQ